MTKSTWLNVTEEVKSRNSLYVFEYKENQLLNQKAKQNIRAIAFKIRQMFSQKTFKGETIEIWGNPNKGKEIVYINDTIQIIERCLESSLDGGMYNVGRGIAVTLEEQI